MSEIRLAEGTIRVEDEWLSVDDIKARIREKMDAGDMKFADLAVALESLNRALEDLRWIEVRLALPNNEYEKLRRLGGEDDNESVRKAVLAFIGETTEAPGREAGAAGEAAPEEAEPVSSAAPRIVVCSKCEREVEVPEGVQVSFIECGYCGTSIILEEEAGETGGGSSAPAESAGESPEEAAEKKTARHKDHFIG